MSQPLWGIPQTSAYLGVPPSTLHQWIYKGCGPRSLKIGRHRKYRPEDIEAWVAAQADDRKGGAPSRQADRPSRQTNPREGGTAHGHGTS